MTGKKAPYEVGAVANFMIGRSLRERRHMTHLKLQKLVYISYGIYCAVNSNRLFGERIEAWSYGPVVPELYHEFKRFGPSPIRKWSSNFDYKTGKFHIPVVSDNDNAALEALAFTWNYYAWLPSHTLVELTHAEGTPWQITLERGERIIEDTLIRDHYWELLNAWKPAAATA